MADMALPDPSGSCNLFLREVLPGSGRRDPVFQHPSGLLCEALLRSMHEKDITCSTLLRWEGLLWTAIQQAGAE
jgi:hypothetical protein